MNRKKSRKLDSDKIDEAKDSLLETTDSTKKTQKKEDKRIPFDAWFGLKGAKKAWLRNAAWEWMKSQGLSEMEEKDSYEKVLRR